MISKRTIVTTMTKGENYETKIFIDSALTFIIPSA